MLVQKIQLPPPPLVVMQPYASCFSGHTALKNYVSGLLTGSMDRVENVPTHKWVPIRPILKAAFIIFIVLVWVCHAHMRRSEQKICGS